MLEHARKFGDLVDSTLETDSIVYISPWLKESAVEKVADHHNTQTGIMSQREGFLTHEYASKFENIDTSPTLEDYLEGSEDVFTAEFLAPGANIEENLSRGKIEDIIYQYAEQSDVAVDSSGSSFYSSNTWRDVRIDPLHHTELELEQVQSMTRDALSMYFDDAEIISGEDYQGVLATR